MIEVKFNAGMNFDIDPEALKRELASGNLRGWTLIEHLDGDDTNYYITAMWDGELPPEIVGEKLVEVGIKIQAKENIN